MSRMSELVHLESADGVATITLDSPHNKNALSQQLTGELLRERVLVVRRVQRDRRNAVGRLEMHQFAHAGHPALPTTPYAVTGPTPSRRTGRTGDPRGRASPGRRPGAGSPRAW